MNRLNKRQIIILVIMGIAILFAAYDFFAGRSVLKKNNMGPQPIEIESFVTSISNDVVKDKIASVDTYTIKTAEMEWTKNPFWTRAEYREFAGNETGGGLAAKIIYSGYVDSGRKKMAVVNGFEYEVGDHLEIEGYVLKSVTPSKILIVNRDTGSELIIPIQE